jgi:VCBS repeat-containing protein
MPKTYRYPGLSFAVADEEEINFAVKFISDGNIGDTIINIPGSLDPEIENEGTALLGKGKDLRDSITVSVSSLENPVPEEDEIRVQYLINDKLLLEHSNKKTEEERPNVVLKITFPKVKVGISK